MIDLRPLSIADQPLVTEALRAHPPEISEHTFTNLFVWRHQRPIWLGAYRKTLVFLAAGPNEQHPRMLFGPPVGPEPVLEVVQALPPTITTIQRLPAGPARSLRQAGYPVQPDRDNADYVYLVSDLAQLPGRRYAKKRNHVNRCLRDFPCRYEPFSRATIDECLAMQDAWCRMRACADDPGLAGEDLAIREALLHFEDFSLLGGAVRVEDKIMAYAVAEPLAPETAVWHFEKAMPSIPGLGQLINHWFARFTLSNYRFVNREQDLGVPGLRQAKQSYYPHHLVEKFQVALR